jgi:orotidine 5'-phosphate decarboxylase subfamily 2
MSFFKKYNEITKKHKSFVCVGLDSDINKLPTCVKNEENPILTFNKNIIEATYEYTAAYKPNFAFYISQGANGIETLKKTIEFIPREIPVIVDIKAGDIGNTMDHYISSVFSYLKADAMTMNILMGMDVVDSLLKVPDAYAFALAITSNNSANDFLTHYDLYTAIATKINECGAERIGAVVGATQTNQLWVMREYMPESIFLIPGIGAQGGDIHKVCKLSKYTTEEPRFLINSSRNIIFADSTENYAEKAKSETHKLRNEINRLLEIEH